MIKACLDRMISGKRILILGFGQEGRSTYRFLSQNFPHLPVFIADKNENIKEELQNTVDAERMILGENYLSSINDFDFVFKTPGISLKGVNVDTRRIVSQTSIFLDVHREQIVGITGTKGKSTTSSLLYHILKSANRKVILTGNIGKPAFDAIDSIDKDTIIVFEMSSHQLEYVSSSPKYAILLNLFEEHLDHYTSYEAYQNAKFNIAGFQRDNDVFIYNKDNLIVSQFAETMKAQTKISFSQLDNSSMVYGNYPNSIGYSTSDFHEILTIKNNPLKGKHNYYNIMAATTAALYCKLSLKEIEKGIVDFRPLEHRLEYVGKYGGIHFYNDSIATIPEATLAAIEALGNVDTLIMGGYDRGIDYHKMAEILKKSNIQNIILLAEAGKRIEVLLKGFPNHIFLVSNMKEAVTIASQHTERDGVCLLSPAAASYGMFKDFKERGNIYKTLVMGLG